MLPFSQQQHNTPAKARMLGALIKVNWIKALGMLNLLEHWAANSGRAGQAPEGRLDGPRAAQMLTALLEYRGDTEGLVDAFCELDVLVRTDTGLQVVGLHERYGAMFKEAATRSESASNAANARWEKERKAKELKEQAERTAKEMLDACASNATAVRGDAKENGIEEKEIEKEESAPAEQLELSPSEPGGHEQQHPLQALWDELADPALPRWAKVTPERRRKADARWKEHGPGVWRDVIARVNSTPFLQGKDWLNLDWLLKPDNFQRVLEGNYGGRAAAKPAQSRPGIGPPPMQNCAVCGEVAEAAIGEGIHACYPHQAVFRAKALAEGWDEPWQYAEKWAATMRARQEVAA